ncbi:mitogen-activated protein kinase kinase kinase 20-like [Populus nigra]|uniref:mitogen-activated protein kinase kinase kinase 20-like n=1 Tax=Populus nigra TaxID=3691 RepID=UPI002B26540C|nr:mitogen-activated protein kinase kinase kinase 20-like [Populus nigra]
MKRKAKHIEEEESMKYNNNNGGVAWSRGPLIGKGGFGSVYLASLKNPKSRNGYYPPVMAVKSAEVSASCSLQKEKEVFNCLNGCPFIIKCFGEETTSNKDGEMFYNVLLEYASGGNLACLIKKSDGVGLPELDVKRYTRSILEGICYIHSRGYVHCDLKPENILLVSNRAKAGEFVAKIGDFGLAKKSENRNKKMKIDPYLRGTALYMAPETVANHVQESPCDIWALGCVVLEMLTGKPAWDLKPHVTTDELLRKIGDGYELPKIPSQISKDAQDFLKRCFVANPMFRFTAEMLLDEPFMSGVDLDGVEFVETLDAESVEWTVTLCGTDDEFSDPSLYEEWSFTSDEGSCFSPWSDDEEGITSDVDAMKHASRVEANAVQYPATCTIPAGA